MKKWIAFFITALLLAALPSCGGTTVQETTVPEDYYTVVDILTTAEETQIILSEETEVSAPETDAQTSERIVPTTQTITESEASAEESTPVETPTTAPAESTNAPTTRAESTSARRSLLDRIKENIDAAKSSAPYRQDKAFFNDAVFVGDSVTMGLRSYTNAQRNKGSDCLGTAQFLCVGSMSYTNVLGAVTSESLHPTYKGQKMTVEDGLKSAGAGKVFIMLGMNDFSAYSENVWKNSVKTLISRIREKNPDIQVFIQSVTPIVDGKEHGRFSNENIRVFNDYLRTFCEENDCIYVDVNGEVMADETGHLKKAYCGDLGAMGIHMSNAGSSAWADYLMRTFCGTE